MKNQIFTLIILICITNNLAVAQSEGSIETKIDRYFESFPSYEKFSGVVLVADGENILYHKAYGYANIEFDIGNNLKTRFQIGSITKAFTSILLLKLNELGLIDLDKTISDYLPYYPKETGSVITIQQLLSNTSGIPHHYQVIPDYFSKNDHYYHSPIELLSLFWDAPLKNSPGEEFTYSSPGYYILGAIVQQVTGRSYAELLKEYIFDPLGMKDTYVENNRTTDKNLATGYQRGLNGLGKAYIEDKSTALAAGDLISTAYDLYLWQKIINPNADQILSEASKQKLFQPILPNSSMTLIGPHYKIPYDNGEKVLPVNLLNGSSSGYVSYIGRQTNNDKCVIVLSNINGDDVARIADDIGDIVNRQVYGISIGEEAPLTKVLQESKIKVNNCDEKTGFYKNQQGNYVGIIKEGNDLYYIDFNMNAGIGSVMQLVAVSIDTFYLGHNNTFRCVFGIDANSHTQTVSAIRNGRAYNKAFKYKPEAINLQEYLGHFTSLELQKTFKIIQNNLNLALYNIPDNQELPLEYLEKDLFGFSKGYIRFTRNRGNQIDGYLIFTKDTDKFFGSKFVKIVF